MECPGQSMDAVRNTMEEYARVGYLAGESLGHG